MYGSLSVSPAGRLITYHICEVWVCWALTRLQAVLETLPSWPAVETERFSLTSYSHCNGNAVALSILVIQTCRAPIGFVVDGWADSHPRKGMLSHEEVESRSLARISIRTQPSSPAALAYCLPPSTSAPGKDLHKSIAVNTVALRAPKERNHSLKHNRFADRLQRVNARSPASIASRTLDRRANNYRGLQRHHGHSKMHDILAMPPPLCTPKPSPRKSIQ